MFRGTVLFSIFLAVLSPCLFAQGTLSVGRSYRALALGNTGIASANDSSALFYNPAILANVKGWWVDYAAWNFEGSSEFTSEEAATMMLSINYPYMNRDGLSEDNKSTFLEKTNPYLRSSSHITLTANILSQGLSIAGTYMYENIITTTDDQSIIYQRDDVIKKYGFSYPLAMGQFVIGFARSDIDRKEAMDSTTDSITNWGSRETGTGYDIGILFRMPNRARITLGLVAYNYGGTEFGSSDNSVEQTYGIGISMDHELGLFRLVPTIDVREIGSSADKTNTVHAGLEIGMFPNSTGGNYLSYRIGYNQGYTSTGLEINLFNRYMVIGYANYGEEVGEGTEKVENRRTVYYFSMGF